ncbi:MAG: DsrE/DsrF/TusD sulfur relay family protein [Acidimicrobiales bacterium]
MHVLVTLNDPPYGSERTYNGLRLALNLVRRDDVDLTVFLMGDAVWAAKAGQATPEGYYNAGRMLRGIVTKGGRLLVCGTCIDTRGLGVEEMIENAQRSSMDELGDLVLSADRSLVF